MRRGGTSIKVKARDFSFFSLYYHFALLFWSFLRNKHVSQLQCFFREKNPKKSAFWSLRNPVENPFVVSREVLFVSFQFNQECSVDVCSLNKQTLLQAFVLLKSKTGWTCIWTFNRSPGEYKLL